MHHRSDTLLLGSNTKQDIPVVLLSAIKWALHPNVVQLVYHIWHCVPSHDGFGLLHGSSISMPVSRSSYIRTRRMNANRTLTGHLKHSGSHLRHINIHALMKAS